MSPWAKGPVALCGDAAHPMMPNLGQGGCQATEDGYRLGEELATVYASADIYFFPSHTEAFPNTMLEAHEAYKQPLALANSRGGGPLVPVYARKLASDAKLEDEVEPTCAGLTTAEMRRGIDDAAKGGKGKGKKGKLDVVSHVGIRRAIEDDGDSGEGLVQLGGEGKGEGFGV